MTSVFTTTPLTRRLPDFIDRAWEKFLAALCPSGTGTWLSALRIGLGAQTVLYTLSLRSDWNFLFASAENGLIGRALSEALLSRESPFVPRLGWLVELGGLIGLPESAALSLAWWALLFAGTGLLAGFFCRSSAILAWLIHLCATKSGGLMVYGVDNFMTIGLFYLMLSPLPDRYSVDYRRKKERPAPDGSITARPELLGFWRRVLQMHVCLIYFFSGLTKALGAGWWNGDNLWRALTRPPFNLIPAETLIAWKYFFPVAGVAICLLEMSYPFLIWVKRTRLAGLVCIIAMHTGIGLAMGMYLFSIVMIVLNIAAFGPGFAFGGNTRMESATPAGPGVQAGMGTI